MKRFLYLLLATLVVLAVSCKKENNNKDNDSDPPIGFTFDGGTIDIQESGLNEANFHLIYDAFLFIDGWNNYIDITFSGKNHLGKVTDLTKKDPDEDQYQFWSFKYIRPDGPGIYADGDASEPTKIFEGGTLFTERLGEDKEDGSIILHIVLKDGIVKDNKGTSHTVALNYTGKFPLIDCT